MYPQYMCILLYVIVIWCNSISEIYCQLEWGELMYPQYMCILLYVTLIWCNGIPIDLLSIGVEGVYVSSVYVHSAICDTYLV